MEQSSENNITTMELIMGRVVFEQHVNVIPRILHCSLSSNLMMYATYPVVSLKLAFIRF